MQKLSVLSITGLFILTILLIGCDNTQINNLIGKAPSLLPDEKKPSFSAQTVDCGVATGVGVGTGFSPESRAALDNARGNALTRAHRDIVSQTRMPEYCRQCPPGFEAVERVEFDPKSLRYTDEVCDFPESNRMAVTDEGINEFTTGQCKLSCQQMWDVDDPNRFTDCYRNCLDGVEKKGSAYLVNCSVSAVGSFVRHCLPVATASNP